MTHLFTPIAIRELNFKNRIFVSPMCQYSAVDGMPQDWHLVHLGSRAVGGAALVMAEATAVSPEGRISPGDTGIWSDAHAEAFKRITRFIKEQSSVPAIQIAHAGRKASTHAPWEGGKPLRDGAWQTMAPSGVAYNEGYPAPREILHSELKEITQQFVDATRRSLAAGFEVVEVHMAHGYLLHQFLSPLSNQRKDEYGGSLENRMRFPLEVTRAVREVWPANFPLFVRISATDWVEGGWDLQQSLRLVEELKKIGVDLIDCSSGGLSPLQKIKVEPGYQVPFSKEIRKATGVKTGAVGLITTAEQAEEILKKGEADTIFLARELLRDPYWPLHSARSLKADISWPKQYERAKP